MSAALMLKTGMRASLLGHLAIFLVEEVRILGHALCFLLRSPNQTGC